MALQRPTVGPCPRQQLRKKVRPKSDPAFKLLLPGSPGRCSAQTRVGAQRPKHPKSSGGSRQTRISGLTFQQRAQRCTCTGAHCKRVARPLSSATCPYCAVYRVSLAPSAAPDLLSITVTGIARLQSSPTTSGHQSPGALGISLHPCGYPRQLSSAASPSPPAWRWAKPSPGPSLLPTPQVVRGGHSQCQPQLTRTYRPGRVPEAESLSH